MKLRPASLAILSVAAATAATAATAASARVPAPGAWTIGPVIAGRNYSVGMPLRPSPGPRGALVIDLPPPGGSAGQVTFRHGPLTGKSRIVMRYRIEAAPGVRILPRTNPSQASMITLFFQRRGDNWSGRGPFEAYRWYATFATHSPLAPGERVLVAPLSGNWTAVQHSSARTNPAAFAAALAEADQVGFVLGGGEGYAKGVFATGPARLVVTDFRVE